MSTMFSMSTVLEWYHLQVKRICISLAYNYQLMRRNVGLDKLTLA